MRTIKTIIIGTLILLAALVIIVLVGAATAQPEPILYPGCTYLSLIQSPFDTNPRLSGYDDTTAPEFNAPPCQLWTVEPTSTPSVIDATPTQYAPTSTPHKVAMCLVSPNHQETKWIDWHAVEDWLKAHPGSYRGECVEPTSTPNPPPTPEPTSTPSEPPEKK